MDFEFSDEQQMLRDGLSRLLTQHYGFEARQRLVAGNEVEGLWQALVDMGLVALPLPAAAGGLGGGASDIVAVAELFGRHLVVEPYLSSVILAGRVLARFPASAEVAAWLHGVAAGRLRGAVAHEEGSGTAAPGAIATRVMHGGGRALLNGRKRLVLDAAAADIILVTAGDEAGGVSIVAVPLGTAGINLCSYRTIDGRSASDIDFVNVAIDPAKCVRSADAELDALVDDALLALGAEAVGAMTVLLQTTAEFASTRRQFGVPIASFQVIAHRLADMKIACAKAQAALYFTAALADSARATTADLSQLKAQVGRLGRQIAEAAVQIHGGIGTTDELPVGHYLKRILAIEAMFGNTDYHLRKIGRLALAA